VGGVRISVSATERGKMEARCLGFDALSPNAKHQPLIYFMFFLCTLRASPVGAAQPRGSGSVVRRQWGYEGQANSLAQENRRDLSLSHTHTHAHTHTHTHTHTH